VTAPKRPSEQPAQPKAQPGEQPRPKVTGVPDKPKAAYHPAPWENHEAEAIQALFDGRATPDQQRTALKWILDGACALYDLSYRPGPEGERDTSLAEGRRFVGLQIVKLSRLNLDIFRKR